MENTMPREGLVTLTIDQVRSRFPGAIEDIEKDHPEQLTHFDTMPDGTRTPYLTFYTDPNYADCLIMTTYEVNWETVSSWHSGEWIDFDWQENF